MIRGTPGRKHWPADRRSAGSRSSRSSSPAPRADTGWCLPRRRSGPRASRAWRRGPPGRKPPCFVPARSPAGWACRRLCVGASRRRAWPVRQIPVRQAATAPRRSPARAKDSARPSALWRSPRMLAIRARSARRDQVIVRRGTPRRSGVAQVRTGRTTNSLTDLWWERYSDGEFYTSQ